MMTCINCSSRYLTDPGRQLAPSLRAAVLAFAHLLRPGSAHEVCLVQVDYAIEVWRRRVASWHSPRLLADGGELFSSSMLCPT